MFVSSTSSKKSNIQNVISSKVQQTISGSTVSGNRPVPPGIIPPGPVFNTQPNQTPNFGGTTFLTSYYQYEPQSRTLKKLSLDNITGGQPVSDYFHKNDESIFVMTDGTIVSILGDKIEKIKSSPQIEKIRVLGNQYIGLSNGKLYLSSDLKNWKDYSPISGVIVDFDVPVAQNQILYVRTQKENILFDSQNNQVIQTESPEPKRFGSNVNSFVKYTQEGIVHNRGNEKMSYNGYVIGDVDNKDRLYIFPVRLNDNYTVKEIYTADNNVIVKVESFVTPSDTLNVDSNVITK